MGDINKTMDMIAQLNNSDGMEGMGMDQIMKGMGGNGNMDQIMENAQKMMAKNPEMLSQIMKGMGGIAGNGNMNNMTKSIMKYGRIRKRDMFCEAIQQFRYSSHPIVWLLKFIFAIYITQVLGAYVL